MKGKNAKVIRICGECVNTCKQLEPAVLLHCGRFQISKQMELFKDKPLKKGKK